MPDETVFVVDDDADVRDSLRALLESSGFKVEDYDSATSFLAAVTPERGACLVVDVRMPDMDGLTLQEELVKRQVELPVIIVTGHGDVPLAVRAMQAGAIDFLEKPYDDEKLVGSVRRAQAVSVSRRAEASNAQEAAERVAVLTPREREVLEHLVAGRPNKVIAHELGISPRTVEIHRAHLMEKMQARSLSDLVRIALTAGIEPG
jgi:two-component system response regulator FixJ